MSYDVVTPMLTTNLSFRNKSLRARNKVALVEFLGGLARPVPRYAVTVTQDKKYFMSSEKKSKAKNKNLMTTFGKSLFLN